MWERWFRADFYDGAKVRRAVLEGGASDIGSMPHFALCAVWTSIRRTVAEVNKWDRGLESTETKVNIQEWDLGFSLPSPLGQPFRNDMFDVREPLQFILGRIAFRVGGTKAIQYSVNITSLPRWRNQY